MRTETMRKTSWVLGVLWILWSCYSSASEVGDRWRPVQGFEAREECISVAKKSAPDLTSRTGLPMLKGEMNIGGVMTFRCFPSDFNPRPR